MTKLFAGLGIAIMAACVAGQAAALNPQPLPPGAAVRSHSPPIRVQHRRTRGGSIVHAVSHSVEAPVDLTTGHATGRRQHKPIVLTSGKRQHKPIAQTLSRRDPASGLPTGQRMH
jgi:hypothetical protein